MEELSPNSICYAMLCSYQWEVCYFLNSKRGRIDLRGVESRLGEGMGGEEGGESVDGI